MTKKLILSCLLSAAALSAYAVESTVTYTYACDEFRTWGRFKAQIYDVAIRISDPTLVGKKITAIRAVINADEGIESTSLWLSKELKLEKIDGVKVTVPDTYSADVPVEKTTLSGAEGTFGQLSANLDTPYELTEEGIYVGYSLTVPSVPQGETLTPEQKQPVLVSPCENPESLYVRASKDFISWTSLNEKIYSAAAIYVSLEGEFEEYNVGINGLSMAYATVNEDFAVKADVFNIGTTTISRIGYSYSIDGKDFEDTLDLNMPIAPNFVRSTVVKFPIAPIDELGNYTLNLKITNLNGGENVNTASSASTKVSVQPFVPVHRPMLEEFTGTWCGWCTRGYYALETLNELYGDAVVLAAYHTNDPMAMTDYPVSISGCPSATLNRNGIEDPFFGKVHEGFGMKKEVLESMETGVEAAIEVSADWANEEKTTISVKAVSKFLEDKTKADYKVGYLLINNGLSGEGPSWIQSNDYAGYASVYTGSDLAVLTTWPGHIVSMIFNDVVVDVTGMMGVEGSIPNDVTGNTPYETEFVFDIASNKVIQDKDKLYVAAFIINPDGTILNSNKTKVGDSGSVVEPVKTGVTEISVEYFNLCGIRVDTPHDGIFVKVAKMSDGTIRSSKVAL